MAGKPFDELDDLKDCACPEKVSIRGDTADRELKICTDCGRVFLHSHGMEIGAKFQSITPITWMIAKLLKGFIKD